MLGYATAARGNPIGAIMIRRTEVRPFTEKQIGLLKTFADQAVIAIENVRLFKELQERNRNSPRRWSSRPRPAEVLRVISRSPTELQPVLDTLLANAAKLSGIDAWYCDQPMETFYAGRRAHYWTQTESAVSTISPLP